MKVLIKPSENALNTVDKSDWKLFRFGDIALNISERVEPNDTKAEIYVGLEHLDPDSIHIRRTGTPSDVEGTKLKVYKGDIIFGKRRAYQRKAAIAHFDGICSAHSMVLRANPKIIEPDLFPFFIHSDVFMNRAIDISEGSLSPTIKWKILSEQKFRLPPRPLQKRLAELLWALDDVYEKLADSKKHIGHILSRQVESLIWNNSYPKSILANISVLPKGLQDGDWIESKDMSPSGIRLLQLADIGEGVFLEKSERYISEETFKRLNCFEVLPGDLLLARMPDPIGRTCEIPDIGNKMITAVDCCVIRINEKENDKKFYLYLLNSITMRRKIITLSSGSTRQRISTSNLKKVLVPKPDKSIQKEISNKIDVYHKLLSNTDLHIASTSVLRSHIINNIL